MDIDRAKQKVAKLLNLSKDAGATEGEADNALRQAEALMRKFGIEAAECVGTEVRAGFDWTSDFAAYGVPRQPAKSCPMWYQFIATAAAHFTDTIVRLHNNPDKGMGVGFYGERSDVAFAVWLQTYLRDTVWKVVRKEQREAGWGRTESEDFRRAMVGRLCARMRQLRKERDVAFSEGTGTALVVVSDKLAKRDAEFGEQTYGKASARKFSSSEALERGRAAGDRVGFSRPISGASSAARLA